MTIEEMNIIDRIKASIKYTRDSIYINCDDLKTLVESFIAKDEELKRLKNENLGSKN